MDERKRVIEMEYVENRLHNALRLAESRTWSTREMIDFLLKDFSNASKYLWVSKNPNIDTGIIATKNDLEELRKEILREIYRSAPLTE